MSTNGSKTDIPLQYVSQSTVITVSGKTLLVY